MHCITRIYGYLYSYTLCPTFSLAKNVSQLGLKMFLFYNYSTSEFNINTPYAQACYLSKYKIYNLVKETEQYIFTTWPGLIFLSTSADITLAGSQW